MNGIVERFDARKGYGFIRPLIGKPEETADLFFHVSACGEDGAPPVDAEVSFLVVRGRKGPQAARVRLVRLTASALRQPSE